MFPFDLAVIDASVLLDIETAKEMAQEKAESGDTYYTAYAAAMRPQVGAFELLSWFKELQVPVYVVDENPAQISDFLEKAWISDLISCASFSTSVAELALSSRKERVLTITNRDDIESHPGPSSFLLKIVRDHPTMLVMRALMVNSLERALQILRHLFVQLGRFRDVCRSLGMEGNVTDMESCSLKFPLVPNNPDSRLVMAVTGTNKSSCEVSSSRPDTWCLVDCSSRVVVINTNTTPSHVLMYCEHPKVAMATFTAWPCDCEYAKLSTDTAVNAIFEHEEVILGDHALVIAKDSCEQLKNFASMEMGWDINRVFLADTLQTQLVIRTSIPVRCARCSYRLSKLRLCGPGVVRLSHFEEDRLDLRATYGENVQIRMIENDNKLYLGADSLGEAVMMLSALTNDHSLYEDEEEERMSEKEIVDYIRNQYELCTN